MRENKEHWLQLAQNVQNKRNTGTSTNDSITLVSTSSNANDKLNMDNNLNNNNNNTITYSRSSSQASDEFISNGTNNDIPKIVGKLGRLSSQNFFLTKQNGLGSSENFATRDLTQESMDQ